MSTSISSRRAPAGPALTFLSGLAPDDFAREVWAVRPHLARVDARPPHGGALFGLDDADELLSTRGLRTPFLRIAKDGDVVATRRYVGGGGIGARIADQVQDDVVAEEFAAGSTLVFQGLHRLWDPLNDLAGRLADELGHPVQVNAYLTPSSSRGFSAHYDTHDVFVLQVAGTKAWRCFTPPLDAPLPSQEWTSVREEVARMAAGEPALAVTLEPGDCLYLPRGWVHEATALGATSLHLTIGVHPVTRADVTRALVEHALSSTVELRRSLSAGVDVSDARAIESEVEPIVHALTKALTDVDASAIAAELAAQRWKDTRPEPIAPVRQALRGAALVLDDVVAGRARSYLTIVLEDDAVRVARAGGSVALHDADPEAVGRLVRGEQVSVRELATSEDAALAAGRELVRAGYVVVLDS